MKTPPTPALLASASSARQFLLAGNATVTFKSKKSGSHFTFRVRAPEPEEGKPDNGVRFVALLTGSDNESSFSYFGYFRRGVFLHGGPKAKVAFDAPAVLAFRWAWAQLSQDKLPDTLEVWHEGRCGRCGRKLTHPESIASGFGPECIGKVGFACEAVAA